MASGRKDRIEGFLKNYAVAPGKPFSLARRDPADTRHCPDRDKAADILAKDQAVLTALQNVLFAEGKHALLIVLQAMDTGGKDGIIRRVFGPLNPQGVRVHSFKTPNYKEAQHDFLWRIHPCVPKHGMIVVFNRSHYEDVLYPAVHKLIDKDVLKERYRQINDFEQYLTENGITILKFFLHISKDEQKRRLEDRLADPDKHWKFSSSDLKERALWDDYQTVYAKMMERCSTRHAPWITVPGNEKWYRNIVVSGIVRHTLEGLKLRYPAPEKDLDAIVIPD